MTLSGKWDKRGLAEQDSTCVCIRKKCHAVDTRPHPGLKRLYARYRTANMLSFTDVHMHA